LQRFRVRATAASGSQCETTILVRVQQSSLSSSSSLRLMPIHPSIIAGQTLSYLIPVANRENFQGLHFGLDLPPKSPHLGTPHIHSQTGQFTWRPPKNTPARVYTFNVWVEDASHQRATALLHVTVHAAR
jgi:hypothetical protein